VSDDFGALCGHTLGFMLLEAPSDQGHLNLVNEINSCTNEEKLMDLSKFYINHFICACDVMVETLLFPIYGQIT
jgi:hypothetical protein